MSHDEYNWIAWGYDSLIEPFNRSLRSVAFRFFRPATAAAILDVGCGTGTQLAYYRQMGFRTIGIDLSAAMLGKARDRLDHGTLVCRGDATCLPYRSRSVDWALTTFVLHEMDASIRPAVMKEMTRVIKENGRLGIVDYHPEKTPTLKGWVARAFIRSVEFAAGRRHYRSYRHFLTDGGIPMLAARHGLVVERQKRVSGGNIGIYQLRRAR